MNSPKIENLTSKERGYLLGLFIGDGYLSYHQNSRRHKVEFCLNSEKDKDIQDFLIKILNKARLHSYVFKDPRFNANYIRVGSQEFFFYISELLKKFKSKNKFSDDFLLGVLSGFIDAEGCVYNGTIQITQKDTETINNIKAICNSFKINCTLKHKSNGKNLV